MSKIIVVGSGFSGAILARKIAEELDKEVLILEKRPHIAGNMYDEKNQQGILVQKYGPHFLNTNHFPVIQFLKQYGELFTHCTKLLSFIDGNYVRLPFNFQTVQELVGAENSAPLLEKLRKQFYGRDRVPVLELVHCDDEQISSYGNLLFEKAYKTYTAKMWGVDVDTIDPYVMQRVPMAMNYEERYLNKDFQYLPVDGFTKLFENLLQHPRIKIQLNTDALLAIKFDENSHSITYAGEKVDCLIYTGAIDELFQCKFGALPYRSLDIQCTSSEKTSMLPSEIVSYPQATGYTRSTEYRKIMFDDSEVNGSMIATEYPLPYNPSDAKANIPYYPVNTEESNRLYQKYFEESKRYQNVFLCGRLAEFKYYNMDICIEHALEYFNNIKEYLKNNA